MFCQIDELSHFSWNKSWCRSLRPRSELQGGSAPNPTSHIAKTRLHHFRPRHSIVHGNAIFLCLRYNPVKILQRHNVEIIHRAHHKSLSQLLCMMAAPARQMMDSSMPFNRTPATARKPTPLSLFNRLTQQQQQDLLNFLRSL